MKKIIGICLAVSVLALSSCGGDDKSKKSDDSEETSNEASGEETTDETPIETSFTGQLAIAVRGSAISDLPGGTKEGVKWLKNFSFGQQFEMTGDSVMIGNAEYYKLVMKTEKGDLEGWASTWSIIPDAKRTIALKDVKIYKNNDILSVSKDKIDEGSIVIVLNEDIDGFYKFYTKDKAKSGWLKGLNGLSEKDLDIELGSVIAQIKAAPQKEKLTLVNQALEEPSYNSSPLYEVLRNMRDELEVVPAEEMYEEAACGGDEAVEHNCGG